MKKKVLIVIVIVIGLLINKIDNQKNETSEMEKNEVYFTEKEKGLQKPKEIFDSIIAKDVEKLKSFFKSGIKNRDIINAQIEEMLKFIDGNVVSYSDIEEAGGSKSTEYFTTIFEENEYSIHNIKTDTGRTYTIRYNIVEIGSEVICL